MDASADGVEWRSDVQSSIRAENNGGFFDNPPPPRGSSAPPPDTVTAATPHPEPPAVQPVGTPTPVSSGSQGMAATFPIIFAQAQPSDVPPILIPPIPTPTLATGGTSSTSSGFDLSSLEAWVVNNPFLAAGAAVVLVLLLSGED